MLFFVGILLLAVGLAMIIRVYLSSRKPLIDDAQLMEWRMDHFEIKGHITPRKVPVGNVTYFYRSVKYEVEIMLKSKKMRAGDRIRLAVNTDNPSKAEHYHPIPEIFVAILILLIGIGFLMPALLMWAGIIQF